MSRSPRPGKAIAGLVPVKRNRFITLAAGQNPVNRELEAKARRPGRARGLHHQPGGLPGRHRAHRRVRDQLLPPLAAHREILPDVQARPAGPPIYHHKRESIDAHLSIVFAALAVTRFIEARTGWSIKRFVRTARRYRTIEIRAGQHILTAEDPLPADLREIHALIN